MPGVQDDWLTILRFNSEANLQTWLNSPERKQLLDESEPFTEECHARIARTGFDQWFEQPGAPPPPAWKQNMVVLLVLYPLVFLLNAWLQQPILVGVFGLPYWAFLFINNAVSVVMLSLILPRVSRRLHWWLSPGNATSSAMSPARCWSPASMPFGCSRSGSTRRGSGLHFLRRRLAAARQGKCSLHLS